MLFNLVQSNFINLINLFIHLFNLVPILTGQAIKLKDSKLVCNIYRSLSSRWRRSRPCDVVLCQIVLHPIQDVEGTCSTGEVRFELQTSFYGIISCMCHRNSCSYQQYVGLNTRRKVFRRQMASYVLESFQRLLLAFIKHQETQGYCLCVRLRVT
jgi:hypothetical protein